MLTIGALSTMAYWANRWYDIYSFLARVSQPVFYKTRISFNFQHGCT